MQQIKYFLSFKRITVRYQITFSLEVTLVPLREINQQYTYLLCTHDSCQSYTCNFILVFVKFYNWNLLYSFDFTAQDNLNGAFEATHIFFGCLVIMTDKLGVIFLFNLIFYYWFFWKFLPVNFIENSILLCDHKTTLYMFQIVT